MIFLRNLKICSRYPFTSLSTPPNTSLLQQVEAKVFQVMWSFPQIDRSVLTRSSTFRQLNLDSLDGVNAVCQMQQIFGFDVSQKEALSIQSVGKAIELFHNKMNQRMINKLSKPISSGLKH